MLYDWLLTLEAERKFLWLRKSSLASWIYVANRAVAIMLLINNFLFYLKTIVRRVVTPCTHIRYADVRAGQASCASFLPADRLSDEQQLRSPQRVTLHTTAAADLRRRRYRRVPACDALSHTLPVFSTLRVYAISNGSRPVTTLVALLCVTDFVVLVVRRLPLRHISPSS